MKIKLTLLITLAVFLGHAGGLINPRNVLAQGVCFLPSGSYSVQDWPSGIAMADLDGDHDVDPAVIHNFSGVVSIFRNDGGGSFTVSACTTHTYSGAGIVAADLDNDMDTDLIITSGRFSSSADSIATLFNDGTGSFVKTASYAVGQWPGSLCSGDFDEDGDADLAVANSASNYLTVLMNLGDGTFGAGSNYNVAAISTEAIVSPDLDGDGDNDLVVSTEGPSMVLVLLNTGSGGFASPVDYPAGGYGPESIAAADLDNDGDQDIAVANRRSDVVSVLLNSGGGVLMDPVSFAAGDLPGSLIVSDVNGDMRDDLLVTNFQYDHVTVLTNDGDGTFAVGVSIGAGNEPAAVASADLDGDLDQDLAVANYSNELVTINENCLPGQYECLSPDVFCDDFGDGDDAGWSHPSINCTWSIGDGRYGTSLSGDRIWCISAAGDESWSNYVVEVDVMATLGVDKVLLFRFQDESNFYALNVRSDWGGLDEVTVSKMENGVFTADIVTAFYPTQNGQWYRLQVAAEDNVFTVWVDQSYILSWQDLGPSIFWAGSIAVAGWTGDAGATTVLYDNARVYCQTSSDYIHVDKLSTSGGDVFPDSLAVDLGSEFRVYGSGGPVGYDSILVYSSFEYDSLSDGLSWIPVTECGEFVYPPETSPPLTATQAGFFPMWFASSNSVATPILIISGGGCADCSIDSVIDELNRDTFNIVAALAVC